MGVDKANGRYVWGGGADGRYVCLQVGRGVEG